MTKSEIQEMANAEGKHFSDFLALTQTNDPFWVIPSQIEKAQWFKKIWEKHGMRGVHIRRLHYTFLSTPGALDVNGEKYENDDDHWAMIKEGAKYARILGLVNAGDFVDKNSPPVNDFTDYRENVPHYDIDGFSFTLPNLDFNIWEPTAEISGYGYSSSDQYYHLEVWTEKSTMDDILIPVCRRHNVVYKTFNGTASITACIKAIERQQRTGKPSRIFYISDFDVNGYRMPVSVARIMEIWKQDFNPDLDICIKPLALTAAQIDEYQLPRTPIPPLKGSASKASKKARETETQNFERVHGHGVTELDALEALHPGVLGSIVGKAIEEFRNDDIVEFLNDAEDEAQNILDEEISEIMQEHENEISEIDAELEEIARASLGIREQIAPIKARLEAIKYAVQEKIDNLYIELPLRPEPVDPAQVHVFDDWLYNSNRDYKEQLEYYRRHKNGK